MGKNWTWKENQDNTCVALNNQFCREKDNTATLLGTKYA